MDFVAIDFETATSQRNSICEIGLAFVEDNKIIETRSWLVKPKGNIYDSFNIYIHGIKPEDTANKPEFDIVWEEILPLIDGKTLVAHNARFDMYVLRDTLDLYHLDYPNVNTICSCILSRKVFPGLISYGLDSLSQSLGIKMQTHHRAEDDAITCAKICIKAFEKHEIKDFDDILNKFRIIRGVMRKDDRNFISSKTKSICDNRKRTRLDVTDIFGDTSKHDIENIFYEKTVVFTGTLSSMKRSDAWQIVADIGGFPSDSLNKKTNFLVVGQQDYRIVGNDGLSEKQEKAKRFLEKGVDIEVITEEDFLKNINLQTEKKESDILVNNEKEREEYHELIQSQKEITEYLQKEEQKLNDIKVELDEHLDQLVKEIQLNGAASEKAEKLRKEAKIIGAFFQKIKNIINDIFATKIKQDKRIEKLRKK